MKELRHGGPMPSREMLEKVELDLAVSLQVERYISFGFNGVLGQTPEEYRRGFDFSRVRKPEEYRDRFDIALVVDPRIDIPSQHRLAGVHNLHTYITNVTSVPSAPYLVFTHDGSRFLGKSPEEAGALFDRDEIGCPQIEVTALYLQYLEFFAYRGIMSGGSTNGHTFFIPSISTFGLRPAQLFISDSSYPSAKHGVLSRGKEIIMLG